MNNFLRGYMLITATNTETGQAATKTDLWQRGFWCLYSSGNQFHCINITENQYYEA